jgi:hypothetical protein
MRRGARAALAAAVLVGGPVAAQDTTAAAATAAVKGPPRPWLPPLASLVVPGAGQLLLGQDRGLVYLAIEAFTLGACIRETNLAQQEGDLFRDLAFDVARRAYDPVVRDTAFEYFETMAHFDESGLYDLDPGPALVPESNPGTYNGAQWLLARRTFWQDPETPPDPTSPEYIRAIQFYQARAVGPNFQWSWRNAPLEQATFRQSIERSDDAYRGARSYLGLLLANHAVSFADALVSSRLTRLVGRPAKVSTRLHRSGARVAVSLRW